MPKAFAGDGTEGQRTEKDVEEDFRYVKKLSFAERFKLPTVEYDVNSYTLQLGDILGLFAMICR